MSDQEWNSLEEEILWEIDCLKFEEKRLAEENEAARVQAQLDFIIDSLVAAGEMTPPAAEEIKPGVVIGTDELARRIGAPTKTVFNWITTPEARPPWLERSFNIIMNGRALWWRRSGAW